MSPFLCLAPDPDYSGAIARNPSFEGCEMKRDTRTEELAQILSQMPLQEIVSLANMKKEDVEVLQGVFDYYIRNRFDPDDKDYENIMHELWEIVRETHRLRVVK